MNVTKVHDFSTVFNFMVNKMRGFFTVNEGCLLNTNNALSRRDRPNNIGIIIRVE